MSPLGYLFSNDLRLESIASQPTTLLAKSEVPSYGWVSVPAENSVAFEAGPNLRMWAFYRSTRERLEIVSPFGCCHLPLIGSNPEEPIGLVTLDSAGELAAWKVKFDSQWRNARGDLASPEALKAKSLPDGSFEPLHSSMSFRGIDSKPDFWAMVLLPAVPERIYAQEGGARMEVGGRAFALPPGKASEHVLAGRVQWALPDESGFFALQKR